MTAGKVNVVSEPCLDLVELQIDTSELPWRERQSGVGLYRIGNGLENQTAWPLVFARKGVSNN